MRYGNLTKEEQKVLKNIHFRIHSYLEDNPTPDDRDMCEDLLNKLGHMIHGNEEVSADVLRGAANWIEDYTHSTYESTIIDHILETNHILF